MDTKLTETVYEVFALTVHGSDVVEKDTLEQALECAKKWSVDSKHTSIMVVKVDRTRVAIFEDGGEKQ